MIDRLTSTKLSGRTMMNTPANIQAEHDKRRDICFAEKDEALRNNVRELGTMVGELLLEQGGEALFRTVESARRLAIARREGEPEAADKLTQLLGRMSPSAARDVIRAFSMYFQVVNTAEQVHRIRRRRDYLKDSSQRQPRSMDATFFELRRAGFSLEAIEALLQKLAIEPVFTAHPTETTRRTILRKQQNIVRRMVEAQNPALTPQEYNACLESIRADITVMWQTEESPTGDQTVQDELEHTLFFLTDVIYRVMPPFYEALETALVEAYGEDARRVKIPNLVRFGSWTGGDLSTNDDISARTIRETFARERSLVLNLYYRDCMALSEKLSQSELRVAVDPAVVERIEDYGKQFSGMYGSTPHRHRNMPYRILLRLICARLKATYEQTAFPYESPDQFIRDLQLVANSLANRRGQHAGLFIVKRVIRRAETFGFHFASLDIRHNAHDLQQLVGECLGEADWLLQAPEQRARRIRRVLQINDSPVMEPDNNAKRLFAVFRSISYCRKKFGERAIGSLLIRHCEDIDDILAALLVARWSDIHSADGSIPLDIVPCFENSAELERAPKLVAAMLHDEIYRRNLVQRGSHQVILLSISDATHDGSVVSSRWKMHRCHTELSALLEKEEIDFTFFHGRGSLSGRGGVADGIARGHLRATEHGEAVNERYGVRGIAMRTLEKAFSAVTLATAGIGINRNDDPDWHATVAKMGVTGDAAFAKLSQAGFDDYFQLATPIDVIEHMRLGSHSRANETTYAQRNLPWTFAWAQSRFLLPSWYGFGHSVEALAAEQGMPQLRNMLQGWPFFNRLVYDIEIALAIADPGIARQYSQLAGAELHGRFFAPIQEEFDRSVAMLLELRERSALLESSATLRRSIRLRNPYVDPMSLLQVDMLARWRAGNRQDEKLLSALRASVNGIARGLQTTG